MTISDIISLCLGIALFLFGMSLMGESIKRISGNRLGPILYKLTNTPLKGFLLGSSVTAIIQSSSATSVLVVGFTDSGMLKLKQAIPIILGAIFGTSITGWILCLSYIDSGGQLGDLLSTATLTGVVAVAGVLLRMFAKKKTSRRIGDMLIGFGVLMLGMSIMSGAVSGLKEQVWFNDLLVSLENPFLGILIGILIAAVLQSASAAVGIVQALSVTGAVTLGSALPVLMGIAVGAALPVLLAALGANTEGRRTALSYLAAALMGVMTCASVFYIVEAVVHLEFLNAVMSPFSVALLNTAVRLAVVGILIPFTDVLEALVSLLIPEKQRSEEVPRLSSSYIRHPSLAIEQCRQKIGEMARQSEQAVLDAGSLISRYSDAVFERVAEKERSGDQYEDMLGSFLMKLSEQELSEKQGRESSVFLHTIPDFERISDHALNVAESARELEEKHLVLSDEAMHEFSVLIAAAREILHLTTEAFIGEDVDLAERVEPLEEVIDDLCDTIKLNHVERLRHGQCSIEQGFVLNDLVTNYERISDHCSNIAVAIIEICSGDLAAHEYLGMVKSKHTEGFERYYHEYRTKFAF